jgi:anti-anti-sigma factor
MSSGPHFELEVDGNGEQRKLLLAGEMDISTTAELSDTVTELCQDGAREIVLDLRELSFIDSSGVRTLLTAHKLCSEHGCQFVVGAGVPEAVQRVFDVAGVGELLEFQ